jgi:hypothetical protein
MHRIQQTVIIGLGPLGRKSLEYFKQRIQQVYGELPAIKLLAFDIPQISNGAVGPDVQPTSTNLGSTELIELNLEELLKAPQNLRARYPWLPERVTPNSRDWHQSRAAARLAWHHNIEDTRAFLEHHLQQLATVDVRDAMVAKGFEIASEQNDAALVVIAGLNETVGSALLLDVTYLVHYIYQRRWGIQLASTGLLYMPPMAPSNPPAEACAYAVLKELDHYMGGYKYTCQYPYLPVEVNSPPFNRGCYLVDTRSEKGLTLHSQEESALLSAEWLFRVLLTPIKGNVDGFADTQGGIVTVENHPAAYSSLGFASYVLPVEALIEWSANRLSSELILEHLLKSESFAKVNTQLSDFLNETHLRPDAMMSEELRLGPEGKPIRLQNEYINRLKTVPYDQLTSAVQQTVAAIGKEMLPNLKTQIEKNASRVLQELNEAIRKQITAILHEWPNSGLSLASQFALRLRDDAGRFSGLLQRREAAFQGRNQQLVNFLNHLGPALKNAVASIPSYPVIGFALLAGLLTPLLVISAWGWQGLSKSSPTVAVIVIVMAWLLTIGAGWYTVERTNNGIKAVRDQYVTRLGERFETELNMALVQAANTLFPDITNIVNAEAQQMEQFTNTLQKLARNFKSRLDPDPLCGEMDFASQRSVLTPEIIEELYQQQLGAGEIEARISPLMDQAGALDRWQEYSSAEIEEKLLVYGRQVFAEMRNLHVEALLSRRISSKMPAEYLIKELQDKSAPLWTYDSTSLGQTSRLEGITIAGMESHGNSEFMPVFKNVSPGTVFEDTGDCHSLVVTSLRKGMPLFGLYRMDEFRRNYLEGIRSNKEPLHVDDESALTGDINPPSEQVDLDAPTTFAVGLALGIVKQDSGGVYRATSPGSKSSRELTANKVEAVILLGADEKFLAQLNDDLHKLVSKKGTTETARELETFLEQMSLSRWERVRIERYISLLHA